MVFMYGGGPYVHLLKQPSYKLTYWQSYRVEKLVSYANLVRILYKKEILNEADPISRRPDFIHIDNMYISNESL